MPTWGKLAKSAKAFLTRVRDEGVRTRVFEKLDKNVEIEAIPRIHGENEMFHIAITTDEDSGGWVFELLERNIRLCIEEKTQKVQPYRHKYPEWWLVLIDYISPGLAEEDRAEFARRVQITHEWHKVIVVNPLDHTKYFEL